MSSWTKEEENVWKYKQKTINMVENEKKISGIIVTVFFHFLSFKANK